MLLFKLVLKIQYKDSFVPSLWGKLHLSKR